MLVLSSWRTLAMCGSQLQCQWHVTAQRRECPFAEKCCLCCIYGLNVHIDKGQHDHPRWTQPHLKIDSVHDKGDRSFCRCRLEQMPYMEFYQGLRERNWTSPWYKADAPPWRLQLFQDSGRFMAPAFPGYRCTAT